MLSATISTKVWQIVVDHCWSQLTDRIRRSFGGCLADRDLQCTVRLYIRVSGVASQRLSALNTYSLHLDCLVSKVSDTA